MTQGYRVTIAHRPADKSIVVDPIALKSREDVDQFIDALRAAAQAVWPEPAVALLLEPTPQQAARKAARAAGGAARAKALTPERRSEIARNAAYARRAKEQPDGTGLVEAPTDA